MADKKLPQWENAKHQTNCKDRMRNYILNKLYMTILHQSNMVYVVLFVAQALRFYGSFNVTVTGITIRSSPQFHLKFDNCIGVLVHDMSVSSPGDSPNTDGIHLQNSKDVLIHSTTLACGNLHSLLMNICHFHTFIWTNCGDKCGTERNLYKQ